MAQKTVLLAILCCATAMAAARAAHAQIGSMPTGQLDTNRATANVHDPTRRAADAYSRGARTKRKAEAAKDAQERQKLFQRAKDELTRSVNIQPNFDALLALGQVDLALGDPGAAAIACGEARDLRHDDPEVRACLDGAKPPAAPSSAAPAAPAAAPPPPSAPVPPPAR
jgi:hypothetical protein